MSTHPHYKVPSYVQAIPPYRAGKPIKELAREFGIEADTIIKLASNENPWGFSETVKKVLLDTLTHNSLQTLARYPDANGYTLKQVLSDHYDVPMDYLTLGNGSNDLLDLISLALLNTSTSCVYSQFSFAVYRLVTQARGARHIQVDANAFAHDVEAMFHAIGSDTSVVFIANPNNPTGTFHTGEVIEQFIARVYEKYGLQVAVVLDEAYNEYLDPHLRFNSAALVKKYPHLVVLRTFSKAYGLAAMRIGFAIAQPALTDFFNRVRQPFNVNFLAQEAAVAALKDTDFLEKIYQLNKDGRQQLYRAFDALGLSYVKSHGNFVLVALEKASEIHQALLKEGVIVRSVVGDGLPNHLRISIGLPEENERFIQVLTKVINT